MDENPISQPVQPPSLPKISPKLPITLLIVAVLAIGGYFASAKFLNLWPFEVATPIPTFTPRPSSILKATDISNWEIYYDLDTKISFKIPPLAGSSRVIKTIIPLPSTDISFSIETLYNNKYEPAIILISSKNKSPMTPDQYIEKELDPTGVLRRENSLEKVKLSNERTAIFVSGLVSLDYPVTLGTPCDAYLLSDDGRFTVCIVSSQEGILGQLYNEEEIQKLFNQILSTFEFTGSADSSIWLEYKNGRFGFLFKYPSDWNISGATPSSRNIVLEAKSNSDIDWKNAKKISISYQGEFENLQKYFDKYHIYPTNKKVFNNQEFVFYQNNFITEAAFIYEKNVISINLSNISSDFIDKFLMTFGFFKPTIKLGDWVIYQSNTYKFRFEYPENWVVDDCGSTNNIYFNAACGTDAPNTGAITFTSKNDYQKQIDIYRNDYSKSPTAKDFKETEVIIDNLKAVRFSWTIGPGGDGPGPQIGSKVQFIIFQHGDSTFNIDFVEKPGENLQPTFDRMVSSIKLE